MEWNVIKPKRIVHHDIKLLDGSCVRLNCSHKAALINLLDTLELLSDEYVTKMNEYRLLADKPLYDKYFNMAEALRIVFNNFIDESTEVK